VDGNEYIPEPVVINRVMQGGGRLTGLPVAGVEGVESQGGTDTPPYDVRT
jgi:hypothetical protein